MAKMTPSARQTLKVSALWREVLDARTLLEAAQSSGNPAAVEAAQRVRLEAWQRWRDA